MAQTEVMIVGWVFEVLALRLEFDMAGKTAKHLDGVSARNPLGLLGG